MKRTALLLLLLSSIASAQTLRVGTAKVDITPPVGAAFAGGYHNRYATGTHDPLFVRAMVIESSGTKIAMAACDLVSLPREISQQARAIVASKIGLAADHVMISATHDHTTPVVLTKPSRYNLQGEPLRITEQFTNSLPEKIADAILQANASLQPAQLRAAVGDEPTLGFNRRFFMKDGSVGWNPGKLNPNIVRPAGPVDTTVPVLFFESPDEKTPIAAYVNFGVHQDTTGGLKFSADYSYTLGRVLKMAKGDDFFTLFTIGAAGNVNHIDVSTKKKQGGYQGAARIGAVLAGDVLKVIQQAPIVPDPVIRVSDRVLQFPVPHYTAQELEDAQHIQDTFGTPHAAPFLQLVKAGRILELAARNGKPLDAEVQVFTIGDKVAIVSFPGELFAELGLTIKQDSPFPVTIITELANGALVYIPNRIAYEEGNYEPIAARLPEGAGETLMNSALDQLLQLARRSPESK